MKDIFHDRYVILEEETHHFKVKTHLFLSKIDLFWGIYEGWLPLAMLVEGHFMEFHPPFHFRGAPLYRMAPSLSL
jgi:hypothetical protein